MGLAVPRREPTPFLNGLHHRLENRHTKGRNKEAIPFFGAGGLIVFAQLGYLRKYTTTWNNDDNLSIRNLLIGSALQVLGVKKLKSG
ncbi:hypothetical protein DN752_21840 [Echinicola strongylocentroti]|uniref:HIG1 domain-containing protein n=1 Tax=Echinicola strongylocentroti TaxID=1795355 RepID=A0A2Z4IPU5_9BACT|nr:hypothetical protein DN752_21840 [Echinicola strongylocentroti]